MTKKDDLLKEHNIMFNKLKKLAEREEDLSCQQDSIENEREEIRDEYAACVEKFNAVTDEISRRIGTELMDTNF
jgi:outer membrane murein-binding lipoprotein Lpp